MIGKKRKLLKEIKNIIRNNQSYDSQKENIQFLVDNCNYKDLKFKSNLGQLFADLIMNDQFIQKPFFFKYYECPKKAWEEKMLHFMDLDFNPNQYVDNVNVLFFCMDSHKEIALKLLTKDIDVYAFSNVDINNKGEYKPAFYSHPCCYSALDDENILDGFIEAGLNLDYKYIAPNAMLTKYKKTILMYAMEEKNEKYVRLLLDRGIDPNESFSYNVFKFWAQTPLLSAVYDFKKAIPLLLEAGADYKNETYIVIKDYSPVTVFDYAKYESKEAYKLIKAFDENKKILGQLPSSNEKINKRFVL